VTRLARGILVRTRSADLVAALCVLLLATIVAYRYLDERFDFSYRDCSEDLLYPCIGRFGWTIKTAPLEASTEWQAFVQRRVTSLDCDAFRELPQVDAGHTWDLQRYLHATLSGLFWLNGPHRSVFVGFLTFMFGLTVLACYGLFRLAVSPLIASLATLPMIFSDLHLRSAIHPNEYVKAPFILGSLFFLGLIVRRELGLRGLISVSVAAGLTVGLGIGFKPDVLVCLPLAVVVIAAFAPTSWGSRRRALAIATFLLAVSLSGWPMLKKNFFDEWGSLLPVQLLGGMDRSFADYYAQPSLYDYGLRFDDSHVTFLINSYNQRVHGSRTVVEFYSKEMQRAATLLLIDLDRIFPSDLLLRTWAGIVNILKLSRFGVPAALLVVPVLFLIDVRLGSCVAFLLLGAVGYVSLVFQPKHFFHLEWVPWWFAAIIVEQGVMLLGEGSRKEDSRAPAHHRVHQWVASRAHRILLLGVLVLALFAAFILVRQHQQSRVTALVDAYGRANEERVATVAAAADDGSTRVSLSGLGSAPHPTPLVEDYLVLEVECRAFEDADIIGVYQQPTSPRERMTVPCSTAQHWRLFWPLYQYPTLSRFEWFEWSSDAPVRITAINRVKDLSHLPVLLKLAVPDDFENRRWYQTLRPNFFFDPLGVRPSPKG
jgi:hypothetical protein